eukprot:TRINITY_DN4722_c2_g1_i1.p1 TRINITY_DN4722_c2_g1~~TRINITY_DN4722_c2_g1_i1.p1  ORF type:complete len:428 (+),score=75.55 TRINITY_DN4722_c2_g1_i1:118-1401(+)
MGFRILLGIVAAVPLLGGCLACEEVESIDHISQATPNGTCWRGSCKSGTATLLHVHRYAGFATLYVETGASLRRLVIPRRSANESFTCENGAFTLVVVMENRIFEGDWLELNATWEDGPPATPSPPSCDTGSDGAYLEAEAKHGDKCWEVPCVPNMPVHLQFASVSESVLGHVHYRSSDGGERYPVDVPPGGTDKDAKETVRIMCPNTTAKVHIMVQHNETYRLVMSWANQAPIKKVDFELSAKCAQVEEKSGSVSGMGEDKITCWEMSCSKTIRFHDLNSGNSVRVWNGEEAVSLYKGNSVKVECSHQNITFSSTGCCTQDVYRVGVEWAEEGNYLPSELTGAPTSGIVVIVLLSISFLGLCALAIRQNLVCTWKVSRREKDLMGNRIPCSTGAMHFEQGLLECQQEGDILFSRPEYQGEAYELLE